MAGWPIVGHDWAVDLLKRAIMNGRLSHAYLFTGPAQVGKTTLARTFAQALLCETGSSTPCGVCRTCQRVSEGRYPDLQVIAAEKNTLQIEQVRMLQSDAALSPLEGKRKIFIVREIERLTPPAGNALLKTLEEPPPQVTLLLTSRRRDQVLPTIISRCQVLTLRPVPLDKVQDALEDRWQVEPERAGLLARLSTGRLGWAASAHSDAQLWQSRATYLDNLLALGPSGYLERLTYAELLSRQPDVLETVLGLWATWWRDVFLVQRGAGEAIVNLDRRAQIAEQAELYHPEQVENALADLMATLRRLRANVNVRLALDVLALRLPRPAGV